MLAFGWDSSDRRKWSRTFGEGTGRAIFGGLCDLQVPIHHIQGGLCGPQGKAQISHGGLYDLQVRIASTSRAGCAVQRPSRSYSG